MGIGQFHFNGDISKFYSNMIQKELEDVARRLKWGSRENQLASCLFFLTTIRYRCAHDERLYSYASHTNICSNRYFSYFRISSATNNYFAVMVTFKMLLSNKRYTAYQLQIEGSFDEFSLRLTTIPAGRIRNMMGMPNNWRRLGNLT